MLIPIMGAIFPEMDAVEMGAAWLKRKSGKGVLETSHLPVST
jgi:hypothetical protein